MKKSALLMLSLGLGLGVMPLACASTVGDESELVSSNQAPVTAACATNSGINPLKAALAVAMADELGRWDAGHDLVYVGSPVYMVQLSSTAVCIKNACKNTKAILNEQNNAINLSNPPLIDQTIFNATTFDQVLRSSIDNQNNHTADLARNNPSLLPVAHKLTKVGGPVNLGIGACGPHYVFQIDHTNGTALTTTEATNMHHALCFYGDTVCNNNNPFMKFTVTGQGCPTGRTCVAVDPTDGDNGSLTTTTTQGAVSYPYNRLYDPALTKLNSPCITTSNYAGTMLDKCSTVPSTCGYLYCVKN